MQVIYLDFIRIAEQHSFKTVAIILQFTPLFAILHTDIMFVAFRTFGFLLEQSFLRYCEPNTLNLKFLKFQCHFQE